VTSKGSPGAHATAALERIMGEAMTSLPPSSR
jgi:hypothetical protein